jgi:hypothetical protein
MKMVGRARLGLQPQANSSSPLKRTAIVSNAEMDPLDTFGRFMMQNLRDPAIAYYDNLAEKRWKAPAIQNLQAELSLLSDEQRQIVRRCVISAIDVAIHDFLFALQEQADFDHEISIVIDEQEIETLSDGLQGEPFGADGWIATYSKYGEPPNQE